MENNIKINKRGEKFINFMKKYGYYFIALAIIVAITLTVVLTTTGKKGEIADVNNNTNTDVPSEPVDSYALTFDLPLENCSVTLGHATDKLVYNSTLGWFATHYGLDLVSTSSNKVLATADGTVTEIYTNDLEGTVIVIKHNDVYTSKYSSLDSNTLVKVGDKVKKGQQIGTTSASAKNEVLTGAHLHYELFVDNESINPADYLNIESK